MKQFPLIVVPFIVLAACAVPAPVPTLVPLASTPVLAVIEGGMLPDGVLSDGVGEEDAGTAVAVADANVAAETPKPPTPEGEGVRPEDAKQYWVPDAGPEAPEGDRPPLMQAPLSLNPDDHYWFIRPVPSGSRNYDLEWYPFGNDVLRPDIGPYRIHHGLDFPNETGTPILALADGVVVHAGVLPSPRDGVNYYGNTVVIRHDWQWQGKDVYTLYAHTLELFVQEGDHVEQGQLIAGVGSSGEVSGPHVHIEVRVGNNIYGDARNPALWLVPFEGWGTIAGRFVDKNGRFITGAPVTIKPVNVETAVRTQLTYAAVVQSDDVWRENFVVADLPAGKYEVQLTGIDNIRYERDIEVYPGQTSFVIISTNFEFTPPPTPVPSATPEEGDR